jgi:hypothetical protein
MKNEKFFDMVYTAHMRKAKEAIRLIETPETDWDTMNEAIRDLGVLTVFKEQAIAAHNTLLSSEKEQSRDPKPKRKVQRRKKPTQSPSEAQNSPAEGNPAQTG